ncbi:MAG TPA: aminodeoxychorismate synthase component I [Steroidobacter sp.]|nr:aminodeoxychorismate synthase component I [Steroidobacter sp.]
MAAGPVVQSMDVNPDVLLALHSMSPGDYPALLQSAAVGQPLGRHDILFVGPGDRLTLHRDARLTHTGCTLASGSFLRELDAWRERERAAQASVDLPFTGGWLVYLGYELAAQIEPRLRLPQPERGPIAQAIRIPAALIYKHETGEGWFVAEPAAACLAEKVERDLASNPQLGALRKDLVEAAVEEEPAHRFTQAVEAALAHIAAGDIYQANLSRAWRARLQNDVRPAQLYSRLRETNPAPFCAVAQFDDLAIVSSSPERLVEVRGREVSTRPIAGTRPRGATGRGDRALMDELSAHPKERAEHVMLIDLERNDLGRVCEAGSVHVDEFMTIESYAHVHHIVSNVRGRLRPLVTSGEVLAAVFPGGTITGCPKIRCMEIIAQLEAQARGAYTGALGYLNLNGDMDLNILIRSIAVHGQDLSLRAGAGIVADSDPQRELAETRAKARGVLRALGAEGASP